MDLVVSRRFDEHGLEYFALTHKGITICSYTPDIKRLQVMLMNTIKNIVNAPMAIGLYDVETRQMREVPLSTLGQIVRV